MFVRQGVQFGVTIALARLLTPADFGTVSMLYLFAGLAGTFATGGLTTALIQARDVSRADESTVFWFNLAVGLLMGLALWLCGPSIARFYETPVLEPLTTVMAVTVVITAAGGIQEALLTKRLNFRPLMMSSVLAVLVSGAVSIWLAWRGEGVWALAAQSLVSATTTTMVLWIANPWRPEWVFSLASARRLFGFGGYMMVSTLLDVAYQRIYAPLIGKIYGAKDLGFYLRADTTSQIIPAMIGVISARVAFPVMSRIQGDKEGVRATLKSYLEFTFFINTPIMFGLIATSFLIFDITFGPDWLPSVDYFKILCLVGIFRPFHILNQQALMAIGRSDLILRLEITKKIVGILIICIAAMFGVLAMAWSAVIGALFFFAVNTFYSKKLISYGIVDQIRDVLPISLSSLAMFILLMFLDPMLPGPGVLKLAMLVLVGSSFYFALCFCLRIGAAVMLYEFLRSGVRRTL